MRDKIKRGYSFSGVSRPATEVAGLKARRGSRRVVLYSFVTLLDGYLYILYYQQLICMSSNISG